MRTKTTTTTTWTERCPVCEGTGLHNSEVKADDVCRVCKGEGRAFDCQLVTVVESNDDESTVKAVESYAAIELLNPCYPVDGYQLARPSGLHGIVFEPIRVECPHCHSQVLAVFWKEQAMREDTSLLAKDRQRQAMCVHDWAAANGGYRCLKCGLPTPHAARQGESA